MYTLHLPAMATIRHLQSVLPESITKRSTWHLPWKTLCVEMQIIYAHKIKSLEGGPGSLETGQTPLVILMQLKFKCH